ncbi:hypothetical protein [Micromonospora sp. NPDC001898]|uniref:hypothetical protein n=1 Tax=Micromonospora sp. NPDC001898 TaxID=3364221 RepID=UPI0036831C25
MTGTRAEDAERSVRPVRSSAGMESHPAVAAREGLVNRPFTDGAEPGDVVECRTSELPLSDWGGNAFPARVDRWLRPAPDAIRPFRETSGRFIRGDHVQSM